MPEIGSATTLNNNQPQRPILSLIREDVLCFEDDRKKNASSILRPLGYAQVKNQFSSRSHFGSNQFAVQNSPIRTSLVLRVLFTVDGLLRL